MCEGHFKKPEHVLYQPFPHYMQNLGLFCSFIKLHMPQALFFNNPISLGIFTLNHSKI